MEKLLLFTTTLTLAACGSVQKPPPPKEEPPPAPAVVEPPLPTLDGDDQVPERFRTTFRKWLRDDEGKIYQRVVEARETSNAVAVVLERKVEMGGECRIGPSTLDIIQDEGKDPTLEVQHFGEDCCPGTTCTVAPAGWHLRYIKAVAAKDMTALSNLVTAKKKLAYSLATTAGKSKKSYSRKDVAAGKLANPPGCAFIDSRPSCEAPDPKTGAFQCACHGGGYHVTYDWAKEGDGFVIVKIDESSE